MSNKFLFLLGFYCCYSVSIVVVLVTRLGSAWHVAHITIIAPYKAFSREKLPARIGTHIGLMHVNITLTGKLFDAIYYFISTRLGQNCVY